MAKDRSILDMYKDIVKKESQKVPEALVESATLHTPVYTGTSLDAWAFGVSVPRGGKEVRKSKEDSAGGAMVSREKTNISHWTGMDDAYFSNLAYDPLEYGTGSAFGYYALALNEGMGKWAKHRHQGFIDDILHDASKSWD